MDEKFNGSYCDQGQVCVVVTSCWTMLRSCERFANIQVASYAGFLDQLSNSVQVLSQCNTLHTGFKEQTFFKPRAQSRRQMITDIRDDSTYSHPPMFHLTWIQVC
jgi:hypothetical protein